MQMFTCKKDGARGLTRRALPLICTALALLLWGCGPSAPEDPAVQAAKAQKELARIKAQSEGLDIAKTIEAMEALNKKYPGQPAVLEEMGFAYAQQGQPTSAGFFFEEAARKDPNRVNLLLYAAEIYTQQGDWESTARALQNYVEQRPEDALPMKKLAQAYGRLNRPKAAVEKYLDAVHLAKEIPEGRDSVQIGALFQALGNRAQAEQWYLRAVEDAKNPEAQQTARLGLLELAISGRDWEECRRWVDELDAKNPGALESSPLASIREELRQWESGRKDLRGVRFKAPTAEEMLSSIEAQEVTLLPPPSSAAGMPTPPMAEQRAQPQAPAPSAPPAQAPAKPENPPAITPAAAEPPAPPPPQPPAPTSVRAYELSPAAKAFADKAQAAVLAGKMEDAVALYRNALAEDDGSADIWNRLAQTYLALGQKEQAEMMSLEARRRAPDELMYAVDYLKIVKMGDAPERYLAELITVREQFPKDPGLMFALARAYDGVNNLEARRWYREFLERTPDGAQAQAARAALANLP